MTFWFTGCTVIRAYTNL